MGKIGTGVEFSSKARRALLALLGNFTPVPIHVPSRLTAPGSPRLCLRGKNSDGRSYLQVAGRRSQVAGCWSLFHQYRKYPKHS